MCYTIFIVDNNQLGNIMAKKIFVCSPLRGDIQGNMEKAKEYCKYVILEGNIPYAPHVFFTQFLDDNVPTERELGILGGLEFLKVCDELFVFGDKITEGMSKEITLANSLGKNVVFVDGK